MRQTLNNKKGDGNKGLIVYITAGCPDYQASLEAIVGAAEAGADIIEIGLPFSDPMADGPVIQKAAAMALSAGATTAKTLELVRNVRRRSTVALAIMTYLNPVLQYGSERFARDFAAAGVSGLIIPDLPLEESEFLEPACAASGIELIRFVAPTSDAGRIAATCQKAEGFLYCVSSTGVTGMREVDYSSLKDTVDEVRRQSDIPVAIGFGIAGPEAAQSAAQYADAVIVGSAVMQRLMEQGVPVVREFVGELRRALDERRKP